jgi:hypothetical protein
VTVAEARACAMYDHARALVEHYARALPLALLLQQRTSEPPAAWLFHEPTDWDALPRLRAGLEALRAELRRAHVPETLTPGGIFASPPGSPPACPPTLGALYERTYFGRSFPMFAAHANDLAALEREAGAADPRARWTVVDRRLGPALLHEILHFHPDRDPLFPPYLDEALAGYLGVRLVRATAFPAPGDDDALRGFPWFAQVGQALVRAFGLGPVLAAHAGARPWTDVLGAPLLDTLERLAWTAYRVHRPLHFHPDTTRPDRWAKLFFLAAQGRPVEELTFDDLDRTSMDACALPAERPADAALEREMLEHALAAMCLETVFVDPVWRTRTTPPAGPVTLDFAAGTCRAPARPAPHGPGASPDPAPLYVLPPAFCAARLADGVTACTLALEAAEPAALAELADALLAGRDGPGSPSTRSTQPRPPLS